MKNFFLVISFLIASIFLFYSHADAMNGWWEGPYGDYCPMWGSYGARKIVKTAKEAKKILQEYFKNEPVVIGNTKEREYFFEADIKDKNNNLIDVVIVDKRTGRIRSIY
ncbi:MAG: hypothetical protein M1508_12305 [Nitrospirae bacterium]|nr:hypothetical protein [Nitrospirota bacterium]